MYLIFFSHLLQVENKFKIKTYFMSRFIPLTIDLIRRRYFDKATGKFRPIQYFDGNPNLDPPGRGDTFTPSGNLTDYTNKHVTHSKWLQGNNPGPYMWKDVDYTNKKRFFNLDGLIHYAGDTEVYDSGLQVCQGNYLSNNCMSGDLCWVRKNQRTEKARGRPSSGRRTKSAQKHRPK